MFEKELEPIIHTVKGLAKSDRPGFYYYTCHGIEHLESCINILKELLQVLDTHISDFQEKLNAQERFLLTLSIYLHDIGMFLDLTDDELEEVKSDEKDEYIRDTHHKRVKIFLEEYDQTLETLLKRQAFSSDEITDIYLICKGHGEDDLSVYPGKVKKLAALLCLVDVLDISKNRAPVDFLRYNFQKMDLESKWHWVKHHIVKKLKIEYGGTRVIRKETVCKVKILPDYKFPSFGEIQETVFFEKVFFEEIFQSIKKVFNEVNDIFIEDFGFEVDIDFEPSQGEENVMISTASYRYADIIKYYLGQYNPGEEDNFEKFCEKLYGKSYKSIKKPTKPSIHSDYALCLEKIYKDKLEEKYEDLACHFTKAGNHKKASQYYLLSANKANHFIPTDAISDKLFLSDDAISYTKNAYNAMRDDETEWSAKNQYDVLIEYGRLKRFTGEWIEAKKHFEKCLDLARKIEEKSVEAEAYLELGTLMFELGETEKGFEYVNEALKKQKIQGIRIDLITILRALGNMYREHDNLKKAEENSKLAVDLMRFLETDFNKKDDSLENEKSRELLAKKVIFYDCLRELGDFYFVIYDFEEALEVYNSILNYINDEILKEGFSYLEGLIVYDMAKINLKKNNITTAIDLLEKSKNILQNFNNPLRLSIIYDTLGKAYTQLSQKDNLYIAEKYFSEALNSRKEIKHKYLDGLTHHNLSILYKKLNKLDEAVEQVNVSIRILEELNKSDIGDSYFIMGKICSIKTQETQEAQRNEAIRWFEKAMERYINLYGPNNQKVREVEYEIKKLKYGEKIPFEEINYLIEAGEYRFHDWLKENVTIPEIHLPEEHNLRNIIVMGAQSEEDAVVLHIPYSNKYDVLITKDIIPDSLMKSYDLEKGKYAATFSVIHSSSGILAMGGIPIAILLDLCLIRNVSFKYVTEVVKTIQTEANKYGMALIGGDLKERNYQSIVCVGIGIVPKDKAIGRNRAKASDIVAITLTKGVKLGTRWAHEVIMYQHLEEKYKEYIKRNYLHKHLQLPKKEMFAAAKDGHLTAAMDTSDGVLACLKLIGKHSGIIDSNKKYHDLGFILEESFLDQIVHEEVVEIAKDLDINPIQFIFNAGHDWEIVTTVKEDKFEEVRAAVQEVGGDLAPLGRVVAPEEIEKEGSVQINMKNGEKVHFPYFTDEKFVQNPYQNRVQEWLDFRVYLKIERMTLSPEKRQL